MLYRRHFFMILQLFPATYLDTFLISLKLYIWFLWLYLFYGCICFVFCCVYLYVVNCGCICNYRYCCVCYLYYYVCKYLCSCKCVHVLVECCIGFVVCMCVRSSAEERPCRALELKSINQSINHRTTMDCRGVLTMVKH